MEYVGLNTSVQSSFNLHNIIEKVVQIVPLEKNCFKKLNNVTGTLIIQENESETLKNAPIALGIFV